MNCGALDIVEGGRVVRVEPYRADYRRDGYDSLGWIAMQHAPLAFLSYPDRTLMMGCEDYSWCDQLPPALTLGETARILGLLEVSSV